MPLHQNHQWWLPHIATKFPPFRLGPAEKRCDLRGREQFGFHCAESRRHGGFLGRPAAGRQQKLVLAAREWEAGRLLGMKSKVCLELARCWTGVLDISMVFLDVTCWQPGPWLLCKLMSHERFIRLSTRKLGLRKIMKDPWPQKLPAPRPRCPEGLEGCEDPWQRLAGATESLQNIRGCQR